MRTVLILALATIGGCPQAKVANYAPDDARTAYKLARGEASIWDGITADDRAAYERVKRKLNERTDREADLFWDAKQRRSQQPEQHLGYPPIDRSIIRPEFQHLSDEQIRRDTAEWIRKHIGNPSAEDLRVVIPAGD